jgi:hypothetical protein
MGTTFTEKIKDIVSEEMKGIPTDKTESNLNNAAQKVADRVKALIPDTRVYHMIVTALAVVAITALVGAIVLLALGKTPLDAVIALGSAAVGALAGALVPQKQG